MFLTLYKKGVTAPSLRPNCCSTCLSSGTGRRLHSLARLPELRNLCTGISFSSEDRICYECKAILSKTLKFKQRALQAMAVLSSLRPENISKCSQQIVIRSLSSLTNSQTKNTFDREFNLHIDNHTLNRDFDNFLEPLTREFPHLASEISKCSQQKVIRSLSSLTNSQTKNTFDREFNLHIDNHRLNRDFDNSLEPLTREFPHLASEISKCSQQIVIRSLSSLTNPQTKNTFDREFNLHIDNHRLNRDFDNSLEPLTCEVKVKECKIEKEEIIDELDDNDSDEVELKFEVSTADGVKCEPEKSSQEATGSSAVLEDKYEVGDDNDEDHSEDEVYAPAPSSQEVPEPKYRQKTLTESELLEFRETMRNAAVYNDRNYKCETCILGFYTESLLVKHNTLHDEKKGSHVCRICKQRFPHQTSLDNHAQTHYTFYECCRCDFRHHTHTVIKRHVLNLHTEFYCNICKTEFPGYLKWNHHKTSAHRERLECGVCLKILSYASTYSLHMRRHRGEIPPAECNVCQKSFKDKICLKVHMNRIHRANDDLAAAAAAEEPAFCAECQIQFRTSTDYRQHRVSKKHTDGKFECSECGKRCRTKSEIRTHIEIMHLKIKRYECETCGQKFITMVYLRNHVSSRHGALKVGGKKQHVCHVCGNKFTVLKSLREHLNTHSGLRPFKCAVCGDTFSYSAALYTHNKLKHLKLRPESWKKKKSTK